MDRPGVLIYLHTNGIVFCTSVLFGNEVIIKWSTFTFNEVRFLDNLITFTSLSLLYCAATALQVA